jgi:hypothetical protein
MILPSNFKLYFPYGIVKELLRNDLEVIKIMDISLPIFQ